MTPPPSPVVSVIVCEHVINGKTCGRWMVVSRGDLPFCPKCKRAERCWRVVTQPEIDAADRAFLKRVERLGIRGPSDHLGAKE